MDRVVIELADFQELLNALTASGRKVFGPTLSDGAIVYDEITAVADLPAGLTDVQEAGAYRLRKRNDQALFGYAVGPHSWKKFLHPPEVRLWRATREGGSFRVVEEKREPAKFAFVGVRSCELHAIAIQDKVFLQGPHLDPTYASGREDLFIIAVNCAEAGGTCFCVSMNTGPRATFGFDLALTEVLQTGRHYFVVEVGSEAGREVIKSVPHTPAREDETEEALFVVARTAERMGRSMDTVGIKELLYSNYEHPRWEDVAARCLTCANCTMVCPTCFCTTIEDVTDLTGEHAERWRKWDSCFTMDFSYIHGGSVRASTLSRYRQWMTHKLATWIDQFGSSGCVGCGRCITWCPVGIDITEEVRAIRQTNGKEKTDGNA
jgi:ferredoxin